MRIPPEMSVREAVDTMLSRHGGDRSTLHRFWSASRPAQQDRYERVLVATIELARAGGYDAVQMRDVAQRSGVALATVYTYYQSHDHLVYRASVAWNSILTETAAAHAKACAKDATEQGKFLVFITELTRMFAAEPTVLDVWVRSTMTRDKLVADALKSINWTYWARSYDSEAPPGSALEHQMLVIGDVFYAGAVRWAFGQADLDHVVSRTLQVAHRLLAGTESRSMSDSI
jgi:AcrR family transcriptional regulator